MNAETLNNAALEKLKGAFPPERWARIERQAAQQGLDAIGLQALGTKTLAASEARHPGNALAGLYSAANRLLLALGSVLKAEDVERFEAALKAPAAKPSKKPRKGGQHDVPPP